MAAVYIVIGVFAVLCLLLLFPISLSADLNSNPKFTVQYLFFKFSAPGIEKQKKKKQKGKKKKKTKEKPAVAKKHDKKESISGYINKYGDLLKNLLKIGGMLLKKVVIKKLQLHLTVSADDAAQTAIEYGAVCAVIYPAINAVEQFFTLKNREIDIKTDFNANTSVGNLFIKLYLRPMFILSTVMYAIKSLIKFKSK